MTHKVMEINPGHPIIAELSKKIALVEKPEEDKEIVMATRLLYQTALVNSGYIITKPKDLADSVYGLMSEKLGIDPKAKTVQIDLKEAEKKQENGKVEQKEEGKAEKKEEKKQEKKESSKKEESKDEL